MSVALRYNFIAVTHLTRRRDGIVPRLFPRHIFSETLADEILFKALQNDGEIGSDGRDRTYDQLINSQLLYR